MSSDPTNGIAASDSARANDGSHWIQEPVRESAHESEVATLDAPPAPAAAPKPKRIIAVGGGKGGIGKSLIASSLGICLAKRGKRVVMVDADLGGANLHTCLGLNNPDRTLSDFLNRRVDEIEQVVVSTGVENLGLISGAHDFLAASNLKYFQKVRLLKRIARMDADFVLLDLGAGASHNIVDFFLLAELGILVVIPEPSSIENVYRFIKKSFFRDLWSVLKKNDPARKLVEKAMDQKNSHGIRTPFDLLEAVSRLDPSTGRFLKERARQFTPRLVVNEMRYDEDAKLGETMAAICRRHLGISMECVGAIPYDDGVWQANRKKRPFMQDFPRSKAGRSLEKIAHSLFLESGQCAGHTG